MKIIIDLLKYFGILLYNAPCIRLSAMTSIDKNDFSKQRKLFDHFGVGNGKTKKTNNKQRH